METTADGFAASTYKALLIENFWKYSRKHFSPYNAYFDRPSPSAGRPPVFTPRCASMNILAPAPASEIRDQLQFARKDGS